MKAISTASIWISMVIMASGCALAGYSIGDTLESFTLFDSHNDLFRLGDQTGNIILFSFFSLG